MILVQIAQLLMGALTGLGSMFVKQKVMVSVTIVSSFKNLSF